ncbi:MAG TPA: hypothetical protein VLE51_03735, partial [Candidatus Saccharimonadales bacterium]|nr:hypothetical protein [Candidatus Saccharimonadales bacterium]
MAAQTKKAGASKLRKNKSRFAGPQLVIFAVVFGLIGGVLLWKAFAYSSSLTIEAEQMVLPAGANVITDSSASGGQAVEFTQGGVATAKYAGSLDQITLKAHNAMPDACILSTPTSNTTPAYMSVTLDGQLIGSYIPVNSLKWQNYTVVVDSKTLTGSKSPTFAHVLGITSSVVVSGTSSSTVGP